MVTIRAKYIATLVYCDQPQLIALRHGKTILLALAIPTGEDDDFIATSVSTANLQKYLDEEVDLRFLFVYPYKKSTYRGKIDRVEKPCTLVRIDEAIPEDFLPERGFFAREHTSEFQFKEKASDVNTLNLDGQWELQEFGSFQQRYSDLYAFAACLFNFSLDKVSEVIKDGIRDAFVGKPLRGGSSYGSLFSDLERHVPLEQKLRLSKIQKKSPGFLEMIGKGNIFDEAQRYVKNYLARRPAIDESYRTLYDLLQKNALLRTDVDDFDEAHPLREYISKLSETLLDGHHVLNKDQIFDLCRRNTLAIAKVALALHRRIEGAAVFFAQGRVEFQ